nr:TonB-dependent receptor plug domain-containing protein [Flavisolibacter sp.]
MRMTSIAAAGNIFTKKWVTGLFLILVSTVMWAQEKTITGIVTNAEDNAPLSRVSVTVKGTNVATTTNDRGSFSIRAAQGQVLVISAVGFTSLERAIGSEAVMNFNMRSSTGEMESVVVTALGIRRAEKALGYSTTTVKGEQLTEAISGNWTDALSGKVAGLNLVRSNSGPAGSNKIILRGENNLTGDNEALIVVDGVVINQGSGRRNAIGGEAVYGTSSDNMPADYGSGLNDINPEDIESVTVLKGPGAAALYGQRGANGAIIITTKSGSSKRKGWGITFNSNASIEKVNRWPDLQFEYGQGLDGNPYYSYGAGPDGPSTSATSSAYGPRFEGQMFYQYDPVT